MWRCTTCGLLLITLLASGGCVRRTISIATSPPGALVWLNDREIGRTPLEVEFLYYGEYDVRIRKEGYEPLITSGLAAPPLWDVVGPDLVAELLPMKIISRIEWTYDLTPLENHEEGLIERARELRNRLESEETGSSAPKNGSGGT